VFCRVAGRGKGSHPIVTYAHDVCFMHSCMLNLVAAIISKDQAANRFLRGLVAVALRMSGVLECFLFKTRHPPEFY
jgi:hypothetical protein